MSPSSAKLSIRASCIEDAEAICALYAQEHAFANTLQVPFPSVELWTKRLRDAPDHIHSLVAECDGIVIGQLSLVTQPRPRRKHVATLGMGVCADHLRQGVGDALLTAAIQMCDDWLNIRRIELEVYRDNRPAIALYRKHGFEEEGICRDYAFQGGRYVDALIMARLRRLSEPA